MNCEKRKKGDTTRCTKRVRQCSQKASMSTLKMYWIMNPIQTATTKTKKRKKVGVVQIKKFFLKRKEKQK